MNGPGESRDPKWGRQQLVTWSIRNTTQTSSAHNRSEPARAAHPSSPRTFQTTLEFTVRCPPPPWMPPACCFCREREGFSGCCRLANLGLFASSFPDTKNQNQAAFPWVQSIPFHPVPRWVLGTHQPALNAQTCCQLPVRRIPELPHLPKPEARHPPELLSV